MKIKDRNIQIILFIITLIVFCFFYNTQLTTQNEGYDNDGLYYASQVSREGILNIVNPKTAPFCYRVFTPFLVSLIPLSTLKAFTVVSFISNWLNLYLLSLILVSIGFSSSTAIIGLLMYAGIFWTLKISFYAPCYVDYDVMLFILLYIYLLIKRKYYLAILVGTISVFQKDSLIFLPFVGVAHYFESNNRKINIDFFKYILISFALPIITFILVRKFANPINIYSLSDSMANNVKILFDSPNIGWKLLGEVISGLGLLIVFPFLYFICHNIDKVKIKSCWLIYCAFCFIFLFGGTDKGRLFMYAIPIFIVLSLKIIEHLKGVLNNDLYNIWLALMLILHYYLGNVLMNFKSLDEYICRMVPVYCSDIQVGYHALNAIFILLFFIITQRLITKNSSTSNAYS